MNPLPSSSATLVRLGLSVVLTLGVLAALAFSASAWGEKRYQSLTAVAQGEVEVLGDFGDDFKGGVDFSEGTSFEATEGPLAFVFRGGDVLRLFPGSEIRVISASMEDSPVRLFVRLVRGAAWVSTLQGIASIEVRTDRLAVAPVFASAYVERSSDTMTRVFAAHHGVNVHFLDKDAVVNEMVVTPSHELEVDESALSPEVGSLRTTKLVKDYPFVYVPREEWEEDWTMLLEADQDRLSTRASDFFSDLKRRGEVGSKPGSLSYKVKSVYRGFRSLFTFDKNYLTRVEGRERLALLDEALYLYLQGESTASERLARFAGTSVDETALTVLQGYFPVFHSVPYGSVFYPVKESIRSLRLASASTEEARRTLEFQFLRERLNEVYDLMDSGEPLDARAALTAYREVWSSFALREGNVLASHVAVLSEERQLLQDLLYREDRFYEEEAYAVLVDFEDRILRVTAEEFDLNEERQEFVQNRLRMSSRLLALVDEGSVNATRASVLGLRFVADARVLMGDLTQEAAVTDYFSGRLADLESRFRFVASLDYLFGAGSFDERYATYLAKESDLAELSDYVSGVTSGEMEVGPELSLEQALAQVRVDLATYGVTVRELTPKGDPTFRLFVLAGGMVGSTLFEAHYDRLTQLFYNVVMDGESLPSGVKLSNVAQVAEQHLQAGQEVPEGVIEVEESVASVDVLSPAERVAVELAERNLDLGNGIKVLDQTVSVLDLKKNIFHVHVVFEVRQGRFVVDFDTRLDDSLLTGITAAFDGVSFTVPDTEIAAFESAVLAAWAAH